MLDINLIRKDPERIKTALLKKVENIDFTNLLDWDRKKREIIHEVETLKARRNEVSALIPKLKKEGLDALKELTEMKNVSDRIKNLDAELSVISDKIQAYLDALPNIPADDVLPGGKENNKVVRECGKKPEFSFTPKDHVQLATSLGLIDYDRGVKMGGNGFWLYKGKGAILEWALLNYFIETHLADGYEFVLPPHLLINQCGYTAGQFPKFVDDVFHIEGDNKSESTHFLLPTAETALINFHRDEILKEEELPKKYFAYTPCYRKEAGSYRASERGMIRGHQFNKIEMFQFTTPENSDNALDELIGKAEKLVEGLGIHFRTSKLAAQDCSASMAKTFDIELWIPSMNEYKEASSCSNAIDFQARRGNIRFKRNSTGKNEFIHSLNASGLATSRLFPAILETHQQSDGSVVVPAVLRKFTNFDIIKP
ncbi:MAG TPA: serine--tRNA ligase [Lentisphaeria bacterium]|nr:MAG: serine--tRNA ligase [Lentisphaerae bacterium GWF2_38_69]HBM14870.1 serine--tRNA ligase [Lentisphaeria bacterium]